MSDVADSSSSSDSWSSVSTMLDTPSMTKVNHIDENILILPNLTNEEDKNESFSSSESSSDSSTSDLVNRPFIMFNRFEHFDKSDDEDEKYRTDISHNQEIALRIRYCKWYINEFSTCQLNTEGYMNSKIYAAGVLNDFQWYFRIEKFKQKQKVFYGVYICILNYEKSEIRAVFRSFIEKRNGSANRLFYSKNFPCKEGFKFLGYLDKNYISDCDKNHHQFLPHDRLTLSFKIYIQYKKFKYQLINDLKELWKNKKNTDLTLIVQGREFPVHKVFLAARSSFFADQFENNSQCTTLEIDEIEPDVMEQILRFIYTGRAKKLNKFPKQLFAAADKCKLIDLKQICRQIMESES